MKFTSGFFAAMSYRAWIIAFALGLTVSPSNALSQSASENELRQEKRAPDSETESGSKQVQPVDTTPALDRIEGAIRDLKAEEDTVAAKAEQDRDQRDLHAQEGMALWAEYMFYATAATVLLTFAALIAIIRTLHHTRRAADYTGDMLIEAANATKAAEDGVATTRDIGEKQVRAYLHVSSVEFTLGRNQGEVGVSLTIANAGQSPAVAVKGEVVFEAAGKEPLMLEVPLPNIPANSEPTRTIRPTKRKGNTFDLEGSNRITVYVTVTAQDVFEKEIKAVSMRTIGIPEGAKGGQTYRPDDAEGFFPDKAVEFLAKGYGRFGPKKNQGDRNG